MFYISAPGSVAELNSATALGCIDRVSGVSVAASGEDIVVLLLLSELV
jgi:hypothetical protein